MMIFYYRDLFLIREGGVEGVDDVVGGQAEVVGSVADGVAGVAGEGGQADDGMEVGGDVRVGNARDGDDGAVGPVA